MLECVVNISEGHDRQLLGDLRAAAGPSLLDVHTDGDHNRSVFTLAGPLDLVDDGVRSLAQATVARLDLRTHAGAHPRIGTLDVVPFVALAAPSGAANLTDGDHAVAVAARDRFARWAGHSLGLPCFLYGTRWTLPEIRRGAWRDLRPDSGPAHPHPSAGACAVGARGVLVAYNLWLEGSGLGQRDLEVARRIAAELRGAALRTLALKVGQAVQVSCNLLAPEQVGPAAVFDAVARQAPIARAELVGLLPRAVLDATPRQRWAELDISPAATIEARLEEAGLDGGRFPSER